MHAYNEDFDTHWNFFEADILRPRGGDKICFFKPLHLPNSLCTNITSITKAVTTLQSDYCLASHTSHVACVNFIREFWDLQFKVDSGRQTFSWQFYLLSEFLPELCLEEIAEIIVFVFYSDIWDGPRSTLRYTSYDIDVVSVCMQLENSAISMHSPCLSQNTLHDRELKKSRNFWNLARY